MKSHQLLESKGLVDVAKVNPNIRIFLRYATTDNFTKRQLYSEPICYLRTDAAHKLSDVQKDIEKDGFGLLIWDAYRPAHIQKAIWEAFPNSQYNTKISDHNRGIAVDLTLVDAQARPVAMPTDLDVFVEQAHHGFGGLPRMKIDNRERLKAAMERHGFASFEYEW